MTDTKVDTKRLPDWWQRETQTRQKRFLILLALLGALIAFFYYVSSLGITGHVGGVTFDTSDHIAFVRQEPDGSLNLYAIRADGTDLRPLTRREDKSDKSAPAWTLDGKNLLYSSNRGDVKKTQIFILGSDEPVQLTYGPERKDAPVASPDGKKVAFITQGAIKTVFINGNEVEQILPEPRSGNEGQAESSVQGHLDPSGPYQSLSLAPDGVGVAGVQTVSAEGEMDTGSLGGDEVARALPAGANSAAILDVGRNVDVQWEPNGKRLIVCFAERFAKKDEDNYILDASGKPVFANGITLWSFDNPNKPVEQTMMLSQGGGLITRHVAWSPDGKKVAFEGWTLTDKGERKLRGIYVFPVPTDMSQPIRVSAADAPQIPPALPASPQGIPSLPRWSSDGTRLLYEMLRPDGKHDIWVINKDLTNPINLTKGIGDNIQGAWAPTLKTDNKE